MELYNTPTKRLESFKPIESNIVKIYTWSRKWGLHKFTKYKREWLHDQIEYRDLNNVKLWSLTPKDFLRRYVKEKNLKIEDISKGQNKHYRDDLILNLKKKSNLSIRKIAEILGINRGIVSRIKV